VTGIGLGELGVLVTIAGTVAGLILWLFSVGVRARVYYEVRYFDVVNVSRGDYRTVIEEKVKSLGLATRYYEVDWWNRGHRTAKNVRIDIRSPVPIYSWEMYPNADDAGAAWKCTRDPKQGASNDSILIEQERLMPGAFGRLLIGYDGRPEASGFALQVNAGDRRAKRAYHRRDLIEGPGMTVLVIIGASAGLYLDRNGPWKWLEAYSKPLAEALPFIVTIGVLLVGAALLAITNPGKPPWMRPKGPAGPDWGK
jgi:hypothetical protein